MKIKELLTYIIIVVVALGFIVFVSGLPDHETTFYENDTIVCRLWNDEWKFAGYYPNRKCWRLTEIDGLR